MKKILFLTGTRADFGKLKSLISIVEEDECFESFIFVTGMHMLAKYGMTVREVKKCGYANIYSYINQNSSNSMDVILSKTILGLSDYVKEIKPDLLVVHGDRVEALAGAIVGSLNNILVAHVEGGEVSGTIDELIRHAVTKLSHIHFVSNAVAKNRILQLGEIESSVFEIGSPDLDVMISSNLPSIEDVKLRYEITFDEYVIFIYHPVTTELNELMTNINNVVNALNDTGLNYVAIYPNNDPGSDVILKEITLFGKSEKVKVLPSMRFEYFLVLLQKAQCIVGNSSVGVREAPFYGLPSVNLGTRQHGRAKAESIFNLSEGDTELTKKIIEISKLRFPGISEFGVGGSNQKFLSILKSEKLWRISPQKRFKDM